MTVAANTGGQPDPVRLAAAGVLHRVYEQKAYANLSLRGLLQRRDLSELDRRFLTVLVYGTLTRTITIDWYLDQVLKKPLSTLHPWLKTVLRLGVWQIKWSQSVPPSAAVDESVKLAKKLVGPWAGSLTNAVLRQISQAELTLPRQKPALEYGLSPEIYGCLKKWYGVDEAKLLAESFLSEEFGVTVRVNQKKARTASVAERLAGLSIEVKPGLYCPEALRLNPGGRSVAELDCYRDGLISVQGEAAMLVGYAAGGQTGPLVIDLCAAPGGKICHLAERYSQPADFLAFDLNAGRLQLVCEQAQRLGLTGFSCIQANAALTTETKKSDPFGDLNGRADLVLADVPCSALGLIAKNPEIRLHMTYRRLLGFLPLQAAILDRAAALVRPGGVIVYSTCTVNPAENEEQVQALVRRTDSRIEPEDLRPFLPQSLLEKKDLAVQATGGSIQLLPHRHGTDGFFIARLRKVK